MAAPAIASSHSHYATPQFSKSRASSTKFSVVSSSLESNTTSKSVSSSSKGKLYRQITPRKKFDRFGVDKTDYKSYFLSSTVFPTAVRATFLSEMQEVASTHRCGFDIVERRPEEDAAAQNNGVGTESGTACTTRTQSAVVAPPPTAVHSMTDRSMHSYAPVVAINILEKSIGSTVESSDKENNNNNNNNTINNNNNNNHNKNGSVTMSILKTPSNNPKHSSSSISSEKSRNHDNRVENGTDGGVQGLEPDKEQRRDFDLDDRALDQKALAQIEKIKRRLEAEKQKRRKKSTSRAVPRANVFPSADGGRLINYHWMSSEAKLAQEKEAGEDIRDPLYINTFFPEERPVRFHKTTLPTVRKSVQRSRPWTVSERAVHARAVAGVRGSTTMHSTKSAGARKTVSLPMAGPTRAAAFSTGNVARRRQANNHGGGDTYDEVDSEFDDGSNDESYYYGNDGRRRRRGPLLEVRPFLANGAESDVAIGDQREKLKGKDGCLNSRVKQCVRFVRYRERLDRQGDDRPLKAEAGRYRPMSKTDVNDHRPPNPPPSPVQKMQRSVDAYRKYVDNIAMQTRFVTGASTPGKYQTSQPPSALKNNFTLSSSRLQTRSNTNMGSSASRLDADSMIVRSVMDSNLPDMSDTPRTPSKGRKLSSSAIYTQDSGDVAHALAIRRISPKISSNRIVPGTRGVVPYDESAGRKEAEETPRWATVDSDDGEEMGETTPTNAIVIPKATKSECLSEYSGVPGEREERG